MNVKLRSGELFAGVGGLGMAVDEVFGAEPAWFCEFDEAPSRVLAHHFPYVPNFGDVRAVDWAKVEHPQILAGGFPCQDVSLAGARRGMRDGTRSGLWSEFAKAIDEIRPDWVVIENVRGLLSADAAVDVEPCPLCVGDNPGHVLRALGAVLGDLAELGLDAEWTGLRASDVGAPHGRFRVFILAWPRERTVTDARDRTRDRERARTESGQGSTLTGDADGDGSCRVGRVDDVERDAHGRRRAHGAGQESESAARLTLLPTPRTTDMNGAGAHGDGGLDLRTTVTLLPTPMVGSSNPAAHGQISGDFRAAMDRVLAEVTLLPGLAAEHAMDWGAYAPAIARWEPIIGRPAPAPVRFDGKGGKARLNPELTEWMMGWPSGWVTAAVIGLSRAEQLKACGNGVVPQQAAAALSELLSRPGVPAIEWGLAA